MDFEGYEAHSHLSLCLLFLFLHFKICLISFLSYPFAASACVRSRSSFFSLNSLCFLHRLSFLIKANRSSPFQNSLRTYRPRDIVLQAATPHSSHSAQIQPTRTQDCALYRRQVQHRPAPPLQAYVTPTPSLALRQPVPASADTQNVQTRTSTDCSRSSPSMARVPMASVYGLRICAFAPTSQVSWGLVSL
jgi:hypothetical protein